MNTPYEEKRNKAVPKKKDIPIKAAPVLDIKDYEYDKGSIKDLLRIARQLMRDGIRYRVTLKIQENEN